MAFPLKQKIPTKSISFSEGLTAVLALDLMLRWQWLFFAAMAWASKLQWQDCGLLADERGLEMLEFLDFKIGNYRLLSGFVPLL